MSSVNSVNEKFPCLELGNLPAWNSDFLFRLGINTFFGFPLEDAEGAKTGYLHFITLNQGITHYFDGVFNKTLYFLLGKPGFI